MPRMTKFFLALSVLALIGCSQIPWTITRKQAREAPDPGPPRTQRWCYHTLANVDCFAQPKPGMYDRLVNVDPPSLFPSSAEEYAKLFATNEDGKPIVVPKVP